MAIKTHPLDYYLTTGLPYPPDPKDDASLLSLILSNGSMRSCGVDLTILGICSLKHLDTAIEEQKKIYEASKLEKSTLLARAKELRGDLTRMTPFGNGEVHRAYCTYFTRYKDFLLSYAEACWLCDKKMSVSLHELQTQLSSLCPTEPDGFALLDSWHKKLNMYFLNHYSRHFSLLDSVGDVITSLFSSVEESREKYLSLDRELKDLTGIVDLFIYPNGYVNAIKGSAISKVQESELLAYRTIKCLQSAQATFDVVRPLLPSS